ncbi:asparagine synthase (glutamine-hydrolyzing) [Vibrio brasiliensis]|uniref:asparagine synthase (glutamine-hydrolyzing) n=1 Tax=Vibrio brasiliensis TaxID=170652 RepID=UPI00030C08AC|nr:asparagine synthase (glutamine-hydrolyzing) [Vibrio brasiliensis]
MCGFVGLVDFSGGFRSDFLDSMANAINHRGPDDSGTYFSEKDSYHIGLAHKRLSIQDLSNNGHQPMVSSCKDYIIVFNGEVYNFDGIKKELKLLNYHFKSNSDTEVILYSYMEWGDKCLEKFIGMFAICIYNKQDDSLFIARDRLGVKPLYYYLNEDVFLFSSELKSFHSHPNFRESKTINTEALASFFQYGYINGPITIFDGAYKLEPGTFMIFDLSKGAFEVKTYWSIDDCFTQKKINLSESDLVDELESLLVDSYKLRTVSDVPYGVFLSGGYDSVSVASLLSKKTDTRIKTFTIGFDDRDYDESEQARELSQYLGTDHKQLILTEDDLLDILHELPEIFDEPFGDSSSIPTIAVSRLAAQDVKVVLSGDGGERKLFWLWQIFTYKEVIRVLQEV